MTIALLVTIGLMLLIGGISAGLWGRTHRLRPIVGGIGLMLVPLGFWLFGITDLAVNGVRSLVDWALRTVWTDTLTWGASLAGAGLVVFIISRFMPIDPKPVQSSAPSAVRPPAGSAPQQQVTNPSAKSAPAAKTPPAPSAPAAPAKGGVDPEDAEIEALLRKRGIM